jgi:hypothetical protein
MDRKQFGALLGFLFVAAWIGFNFGYALLCLVGAALFYLAASYLEGDVDLVELQSRLSPRGGIGAPAGAAPPPTAAAPATAPPAGAAPVAPRPTGRPPGAPPRVR